MKSYYDDGAAAAAVEAVVEAVVSLLLFTKCSTLSQLDRAYVFEEPFARCVRRYACIRRAARLDTMKLIQMKNNYDSN